MAEANDKYGRIYQNLVDAGCNQKTIQRCMKLAQQNNGLALKKQQPSTKYPPSVLSLGVKDKRLFIRKSVIIR